MHRKKRAAVVTLALCGMLGFLPEHTVYAGSINENEAAVLAALDGEYVYEGNVYVVEPSYKGALSAYFAEDGVDLTVAQKDQCINKVAGNVGMAIQEGYLVKVGPVSNSQEETTDTKEDTSSQEEQEQKKKDKKEKKKTKATANPDELTEEEKEELKEKWQTQITEIEENAEKIRNGESIEEDLSGSTTADGDSSEEKDSIEDRQGASKNNESENKILNKNLAYITENGTGKTVVLIIVGLAIATAIFYASFRIWRRKPVLTDGNYTDIHSHILPGVDDGAKDMETTIAMLRQAEQEGIQTMIATPHYQAGQSKATAEQLQQILEQVQKEAAKEGINVEILLGNELYYSRDICRRLEEKKALTLAGTRYVLVEFSPGQPYTDIYQGLRELIQEGYIPILAHMERYECLHKRKVMDRIQELNALGVYMQMNVQSLRNRYCQRLVKDGYIHFLASDSHNTKTRQPKMQQGIGHLGRAVTRKQMEKILIENPKMLREDKYLNA